MAKQDYSKAELKSALESLLLDSDEPLNDARHIHGHGNENHELSMLQTITATVFLDYQTYMVRLYLLYTTSSILYYSVLDLS